MTRLVPLVAALAALSACSGYEDDEPVDAVTQSEAQALDDAAEMLEQRRLPEGVVPAEGEDAGADGTTPADAAAPETTGAEEGAAE